MSSRQGVFAAVLANGRVEARRVTSGVMVPESLARNRAQVYSDGIHNMRTLAIVGTNRCVVVPRNRRGTV